MGLTEVLTIVFIVLKLIGVIDWSWWLVLLPELIAIGLYFVWAILMAVFVGTTTAHITKKHKF